MSTHPQAGRFFWASCIALIVTAMSFAIRGAIVGPLIEEFGLSGSEAGLVTGAAFIGFPLAMFIGGPLCDLIGMGRLAALAFIGHILGAILTMTAGGFWSLFLSTVLVGLGNGFVEAACNPLIAALYPEDKIAKLNAFHVWFPGGIVIGGIVAYALSNAGFGWQMQVASLIPPTILYGVMFWGMKFPPTERAAAGVSDGEMYREMLRPIFLFMCVCMVLTAATELGTNGWIPALLTGSVVDGTLVLSWISLLMALGRMVAGPVVEKLAPTGVLLASAVLSVVGIYWMSVSEGYTILASSFVFAAGVCYFWPTMIGFVAEYIPKTGALGLSTIGAVGAVATSIAQPFLGWVRDNAVEKQLEAGQSVEALTAAVPGTPLAEQWITIQAAASPEVLQTMAILPMVLIVAFGALHFSMKGKSGEKLAG